jgi:hypothetical protein
MSKKPITWLELIKLKLSEEKAKGKSPSIGDVTPLAKKEWVQIKDGKHPTYIQGKAKTFARKKKTGEQKTRKNSSKGSSPSAAGMDIQTVLEEAKLCGKCKKKVEKIMKKKQKGGQCGPMTQKGGQCGPMTQKGGNCASCGGPPQGGGCGACVL